MSRPVNPRVLVVDDNASDIQLARFAAGKSGRIHDLKTFLDPSEALDFLREAREWVPHLIVSDLEMPVLSGLDLLRQLKADVRFKHIPVVIFTTSRSHRHIKEAYSLHAGSVVQKPTDIPKYAEVWSRLESYWLNTAESPVED